MTTPKNPRKPVKLGITGERVAKRMKQIREDIRPRMSLRALEAELEKLGHPISADGLSKIEIGKRKVDADDLVPLAIALRVSPISLLLPSTNGPKDQVWLTEKIEVAADSAWDWARIRGNPYLSPVPTGHADWDLGRSLPGWTSLVDPVPVLVSNLVHALMENFNNLAPGEKGLLRAAMNYTTGTNFFSDDSDPEYVEKSDVGESTAMNDILQALQESAGHPAPSPHQPDDLIHGTVPGLEKDRATKPSRRRLSS